MTVGTEDWSRHCGGGFPAPSFTCERQDTKQTSRPRGSYSLSLSLSSPPLPRLLLQETGEESRTIARVRKEKGEPLASFEEFIVVFLACLKPWR